MARARGGEGFSKVGGDAHLGTPSAADKAVVQIGRLADVLR